MEFNIVTSYMGNNLFLIHYTIWFFKDHFINFFYALSADVLSEDSVLKWYKEAHSARGWSVFMDQMKKFVDWLEQADEGELILLFLDGQQ